MAGATKEPAPGGSDAGDGIATRRLVPAGTPGNGSSLSFVREVRAGGQLPNVDVMRAVRRARIKGAPTRREYDRSGHVNSVAFSPDGTRLVVGGRDEKAAVYDASTGELLHELTSADCGWVYSVTFSPDGTRLVVGVWNKKAAVYDVSTGELLHELTRASAVHSVAFSPDGTRLVVGSDDKKATVYDASTGELLHELTRAGAVRSVAFSPDGTRLAVGVGDKKAAVYDASTGELLHELTRAGAVHSVAFSPDGTRLAVGGKDNKAAVCDACSGELLHELTLDGEVYSVAFSPDGARLAVGASDTRAHAVYGTRSGEAAVYDSCTGELLHWLKRATTVNSVAFSPDGACLLVGGEDTKPTVYPLSTGELLHELTRPDLVLSVAFSPDGTRLAVGGVDEKAAVYDLSTGELLHELTRAGGVFSAAFSPDGACLVLGGHHNGVPVYDASTGELLHELKLDWVSSMAFSPDGTRLAVGSLRQKVAVCDASTGTLLHELTRADVVHSVAFSPGGARLAVGGRDNTAAVYNASTGKLLHELTRADWVHSVAFSSDGTRLVVGGKDNKAAVHDASTGELLHELTRAGAVHSVAFSPDGMRLAVGSHDKKAAVYDASTGELLHELKCAGGVTSVAFSPDGRHLALASGETVHLVLADVPVFNLLERSAAALTRTVRSAASHAEPSTGATLAEILIEEGETALLRELVHPHRAPFVPPPVALDAGSFALAIEHNNVAAAELLFEAALRPNVPHGSDARTAAVLAIPALVADGQAQLIARVMRRLVIWRRDFPPFQARALGAPDGGGGPAAASTAVPPLGQVLHSGKADYYTTGVWREHVVRHPHGARAVAHVLPMPCITCGATLRALVRIESGAMWGCDALRAACEVVWLEHVRRYHLALCAVLLLEAALFSAACALVVWPDVAFTPDVGGARRAATVYGVNGALALVALSLLGVEARQSWAAASRAARPLEGAGGTPSAKALQPATSIAPAQPQPASTATEPHAGPRRPSRSASAVPARPRGAHGAAAAAASRAVAWGVEAVRTMSAWALIDWASQLLVLACALTALWLSGGARGSPPPRALLHALAFASLGLLARALQAMRGFERLAHFVDVLAQSFRDMAPLLFICVALVFFFALAFAVQFEPVAFDADDPFADGMAALLTRPQWFLLGAFNMGMLGDFSVSAFEEAASPTLTTLLFVVQMVVLMVVALNALIALLGDTYDRVTELQDASRNKQRARLILEYYDLLPDAWVEHIEVATMWVHRLAPVALMGEGDEDEAPSEDETWRGRLAAISQRLEGSLDKKQRALSKQLEQTQQSQQKLEQKLEQSQQKLQQELQQSHSKLEHKLDAVSEAVQALTRHLAAPPASELSSTNGARAAAKADDDSSDREVYDV